MQRLQLCGVSQLSGQRVRVHEWITLRGGSGGEIAGSLGRSSESA